jgi:hypothetical protein
MQTCRISRYKLWKMKPLQCHSSIGRIFTNICHFPFVSINKCTVSKYEVDHTDLCEAKECCSDHENCLGVCHVCDEKPSSWAYGNWGPMTSFFTYMLLRYDKDAGVSPCRPPLDHRPSGSCLAHDPILTLMHNHPSPEYFNTERWAEISARTLAILTEISRVFLSVLPIKWRDNALN